MRQGVGLTGAGASDHQQGYCPDRRTVTNAMFDGAALLRIKVSEVVVSHRCYSLLNGSASFDAVAAVTKCWGPRDDQSMTAENTSTLNSDHWCRACVHRLQTL